MTIYTPAWRIKVNNSVVSDYILANLTVTNGRPNIFQQAQASYCNFSIILLDGADALINLNDTISIEVTNSSAAYVQIFGGTVSDIVLTVAQVGTSAVTQEVRVTALGNLSKLQRSLSLGVLSAANDGTQMLALLQDVSLTWAEAPVYTWATYVPVTQTWGDIVIYGNIDTPGDYAQAARASNEQNIYTTAATIATSGLGFLFENSAGKVGYGDSTHRSDYLAANGYLTFSANDALGQGLQTRQSSGDIRNQITVNYGAGSTLATSTSDASSINSYGANGYTISTTLANLADANTQAAFYLAILAYPAINFNAITFALGNPDIDDTDRNSLIAVFMGAPIKITDIPANMGSPFLGFIEGFTFTASYNDLNLSLNLSPLEFSISAVQWQDVSVAEAWNTLSPTLDYANAITTVN